MQTDLYHFPSLDVVLRQCWRYGTSKLWHGDSKFSLPQKKHKSEMYTPYFFLWETLVQALNRTLLLKYGSHFVTRWLLVCNRFWGVRKIPNLQSFPSMLSCFDSVSHFSSRADVDSSIFSLHLVDFYTTRILHFSCDGSSKQNFKFTKQTKSIRNYSATPSCEGLSKQSKIWILVSDELVTCFSSLSIWVTLLSTICFE